MGAFLWAWGGGGGNYKHKWLIIRLMHRVVLPPKDKKRVFLKEASKFLFISSFDNDLMDHPSGSRCRRWQISWEYVQAFQGSDEKYRLPTGNRTHRATSLVLRTQMSEMVT